VEAIAAGTFAIIDITGFRLRIMRIYVRSSVSSHMKNRLTHRSNQVGKEAVGNMNISIRRSKIDNVS
jgi:hypothetical protein